MTMRQMIEMGEAAVSAGSDQGHWPLDQIQPEDLEMFLNDAITHIHHYADYLGLDWDDALDERHYKAERGTPLDEEPRG